MGSLAGAPARVSSDGAPTSCKQCTAILAKVARFRQVRSPHRERATEPRLFRDNDARMANVLIDVDYINEGSIVETSSAPFWRICALGVGKRCT